MPRAPRIDVPGLVYHVTNRGANKQDLFLSDQDHLDFLRLIAQTCDEFPFLLHAYCLMTNHFHLLLQTINDSLSQTIQYLTGQYGQLFNRRYGRSGRLHQGRFHSIPVQEDSYFTVAARYIHLNPVKAGMVMKPEDYPWSSYGSIIRGEVDRVADPSFLLGYFGNDTQRQRLLYKNFVDAMVDKPEPITTRALYRMIAWGDPRFIKPRLGVAQLPR